ncbi:4Fe-4S binding protein [bacterium]|nr:4Fe-4S binding protein [bacterium]
MIELDLKRCELCGTCLGVCGHDALSIEGEGLRIDRDRCILCLNCVKVCPVGALVGE